MDSLNKPNRGRLIIGIVSLLSMSFLSSAPFEKNPQDCEMITTVKRNNKDGYPDADDFLPTKHNIKI